MNYLSHPNLLVQFWAAVNQEFDKILDGFVRSDGWLYQDLGIVAKRANIGSIFQCLSADVTSGKLKDDKLDHFMRVNYAILDAAKTQWLAPWRIRVVDLSKGDIPPGIKRQVGGFFLLYLMHSGQPLPDRFRRKQKISMDSRDLIAMHVFNTTLQRLPKTNDQFKELGRQLVVLFNELVKTSAFEFSSFNDEFITPSTSIRNLLSAKFCSFTSTIYSLKDIRDQLYYITHKESPKTFHSLVEYGRTLPVKDDYAEIKVKMERDSPGGGGDAGSRTTRRNEFRPFDNQWSLEEIRALEEENDIGKIAHSVSSILKTLDFGPILTKERLTGVSDKVLDREMDRCVKLYKGQVDFQEKLREKYQKQKCERHVREGFVKDGRSAIWKEYLRVNNGGNHKWIEDIFENGGKGNSAAGNDPLNSEHASESFLPGNNITSNDNDVDMEVIDLEAGDDEWQTDEDDDGNANGAEDAGETEVVFKKPLPPGVYNLRSPKKMKTGTGLSMPTIL